MVSVVEVLMSGLGVSVAGGSGGMSDGRQETRWEEKLAVEGEGNRDIYPGRSWIISGKTAGA